MTLSTDAPVTWDSVTGLFDDLPLHSLTAESQAILDEALAGNDGHPDWQARKAALAHCLLAMSQLLPPQEIQVLWLRMRGDLTAVVHLRVLLVQCICGCEPQPTLYTQAQLRLPAPAGGSDLGGQPECRLVLPAHHVWHGNVEGRYSPHLSLGPGVSAETSLAALAVRAYELLSMRHLARGEDDAADVHQLTAHQWWIERRAHLPTRPELCCDEDAWRRLTENQPA